MKDLLSSLLLVAAIIVLVPSAAAGDGDTWDKQINNPSRFQELNDFNAEAVLDKETGLVWEQSPSTDSLDSAAARAHCLNKTVGGRKGFRAPKIAELATLADPGNPGGDPDLPVGHPFSNVLSDTYWSATPNIGGSQTWALNFDSGGVFLSDGPNRVWCVRGGHGGPDAQ